MYIIQHCHILPNENHAQSNCTFIYQNTSYLHNNFKLVTSVTRQPGLSPDMCFRFPNGTVRISTVDGSLGCTLVRYENTFRGRLTCNKLYKLEYLSLEDPYRFVLDGFMKPREIYIMMSSCRSRPCKRRRKWLKYNVNTIYP